MSITDRDNQIINEWFEPYKYASISMLERVFFQSDYGYSICRKRLLEMLKGNYIKVFKDTHTNKNIYIYNEKKIIQPTLHRLTLLDLLAESIYLGFNIERFEIEKKWCDGKYRSDGLIQFTVDNLIPEEKGRRYTFFVEIMTSNNCHNLEKYDALYEETDEVQRYLGKDKDYFPKVLLIADRKFSNVKLKHTKVLQLPLNLKSYTSVLI